MALTKIPGHGVNINATGNGQVQFNDAGILDGSANLTFNQVTNTLAVPNITATLVTATNFSGNGSLLTGIVAPPSATAGTVTTNAQPNITSVGTLSSVIVSGAANLTSVNLSGNIIPTISNTYSLGSETFNFKDVYIGPGSLYINGSKVLEEVSNTIIFTADLNQSVRLATSGTGDIQLLPSGTGIVSVQGPLQILAGENITSSNGTKIGFSNPIGVDSITTLSANTELVITGNGSGNVKVDDDLIITGNLTLQGTTGNLSVTNLTVQDNIIDISAETTGVPTSNAGIRVVRGDESATLVRWTESLTSWQFTNDGTNYLSMVGRDSVGNISLGNVALANFFVGNGSQLTGITVSSIAGANVTGTVANATYAISAGTVTTNAQPNITSVGTLSAVAVTGNITSGNASLGNAASANYFVGNGSLLTGIATVSSSIINGNSNVVVSANSNVTMSVAGVANLVVVSTDGITVAGNISANTITTSGGSGNISGANVIAGVTLSASGQLISTVVTGTAPLSVLSTTLVPNLFVANATYATSAGSATIAATANAVAGANVSGAVSLATFATTANAVAGANVSGTVANATYALTSGSATTAATITTNAQPNITSTGTLTSVVVTGNITSGNAALGNLATASFFSGSGNLLSNILGSNVTGPVSFATTANAVAGANVSGEVSLATFATTANAVAGANVSGTVANATYAVSAGSATTATTADSATTAGTVTTAAQSNITSVGSLTALTVTGIVTLSGANVSLGNISNLHITGGTANYVLSTDGTGNLSWVEQSGGGGTATYVTRMYTGNSVQTTFTVTTGVTVDSLIVTENGIVQTPTTDYTVSGSNLIFTIAPDTDVVIQVRELSGAGGGGGGGTPGGATTQIQYNDAGVFAGSANLTFDATTNTLSATNIAGSGAAITGISEKISKSITSQVGYAVTSTLSAALTLPATAGLKYIIHSIYITNIDPTYSANVTVSGTIAFSSPATTVGISNKIPVPARGSLELLRKPQILNPSDVINLQALDAGVGANGDLQAIITYETVTSELNYFGMGAVAALTTTDVYVSTSVSSVIDSIRLVNYSDLGDIAITLSWTDDADVVQAYLTSNFIIPQNSSIELCDSSKRIPIGHKIRASVTTSSAVGVFISGRTQ